MDHNDHVALLRSGVPQHADQPATWADLGSGGGAFTLALADLLGPGAEIYSVDRDGNALRRQEAALRAAFPGVTVHYLRADFTQPLALPPLDGIVMANSLHYVPDRDKESVLRRIQQLLRPGGRLLLVEYGTDRSTYWLPYPLSFSTWQTLADRAGFVDTHLLATNPSRSRDRIYSALSLRPPETPSS